MAPEALKGDQTINEIAGAHQNHPSRVSTWKKEAQAGLIECFSVKRGWKNQAQEADQDALYSQIGRLKVELDALKKVRTVPVVERRPWLGAGEELSLVRQCALAGVSREGGYYTLAA